MYALNNVTTGDDFTEAATLECPGVKELNIMVYNAAVFIQYAFRTMGYKSDSPVWQPTDGVFFPPGERTRGLNVEQVRVRSAVPGKPAQVTIEAV